MSPSEFYHRLVSDLQHTSLLEYVAVISGIASVWFSWKEKIWVYPVGLVNTVFYVYLSIEGHLIGEASVNLFYTIMSIYGWILWAKKDKQHHSVVTITFASAREWLWYLLFFVVMYGGIYYALVYLQKTIATGALPAADAFASSTAYTGMLLMAHKKVESWYWWIITNIASVPLYFVKGYAFTSFYFLVLLIMAFAGLAEWRKKAREEQLTTYSLR